MSVERKALLKRVKLLEEAIGLDFDYADVSGEPAADVPSIDPASIKKQLQDLGYGFVLQLPLDKLKRLQKFYDEVLIFTQFKNVVSYKMILLTRPLVSEHCVRMNYNRIVCSKNYRKRAKCFTLT